MKSKRDVMSLAIGPLEDHKMFSDCHPSCEELPNFLLL